jgi:nucleoside diphosphate kinase
MNATTPTERSLFFIKPEADEWRGEIMADIRSRGLEISARKEVAIDSSHLKSLYGHVEEKVMEKLTRQLSGKTVMVVAVEGADAVARLVEITGASTAPAKCNERSIRFIFGSHTEGCEYQNAVHRPTTRQEADHDLALFGF